MRTVRKCAIVTGLLCFAFGCQSREDAALQEKIDNNIRDVQLGHDSTLHRDVAEMDSEILTELHRATPQSVRNPVLVAVRALHGGPNDILVAQWVCATLRGDAIRIRTKSSGRTFDIAIPSDNQKENADELREGGLILHVSLPVSAGPVALSDVCARPSEYEAGLLENGSVMGKWLDVANGAPPASRPSVATRPKVGSISVP